MTRTETTWVCRDGATGDNLGSPDADLEAVLPSFRDPRGYPHRQLVRIDTTVTETVIEEVRPR